jgi:hypothetical protein
VAGPGLMQVTVPNESPARFAINSRGDFMVAAKPSPESHQQDLELLLKTPTNLVAAELAGQWHSFNLITPPINHLQRAGSPRARHPAVPALNQDGLDACQWFRVSSLAKAH